MFFILTVFLRVLDGSTVPPQVELIVRGRRVLESSVVAADYETQILAAHARKTTSVTKGDRGTIMPQTALESA